MRHRFADREREELVMRRAEHSRTHIAVLQAFPGIAIRVEADVANGTATVVVG